jgi:GNAT superfamily N-acetyltransferase
MHQGYSIEPAQPQHLVKLQAIEHAAGKMFAGWDLPASLFDEEMPLPVFETALALGLLWVALSPGGEPVGFALLERDGKLLHLEELDVHPDHGRKGIGSALVNSVCSWGVKQGCISMTLTTFRHIPWNRPFYEKLEFRVLPEARLGGDLKQRLAREAVQGMDPALRVVMKREL